MTTEQTVGEVRMVVENHIAVISVDNVAKRNAFSPEMIEQLSGHLTTVNNDDDIWVAVLSPEGEHTTAGLDMPKFFGPSATRWRRRSVQLGRKNLVCSTQRSCRSRRG
ncbi:hypothetical protein [Pseudomonas rubra]|uniref:Uncharacterized protein n=1 Tax=Pseudomonas rubra TaxID=2942627 RepID=A0ABT5PFL7_9PSED|nr:hypothetical protein [Pseudomonas rubra]MDD1017105.1 hypothetical protein [Pseudomonas rubra]MDD1038263.1 hypothetical protein [Pseudomonas rubra]MDD1155507.1 hypothetical protein [Pseudomonas rubra]